MHTGGLTGNSAGCGRGARRLRWTGLVKGNHNAVRYGLTDGRVFEVTVREVGPEEEPVLLEAVGD
jgi:hypothetical protein